jgi:hypothetical protein
LHVGVENGTCRELLKIEPALWLFVGRPGIYVTNNRSKRMLRHGDTALEGVETESVGRRCGVVARKLTVVMTWHVDEASHLAAADANDSRNRGCFSRQLAELQEVR